VRLPSREQVSEGHALSLTCVNRRRSEGEMIWGKPHIGERNLVTATRRRIPLLRSKLRLIVRLGHAVGDSAVWERRHRKQDTSA